MYEYICPDCNVEELSFKIIPKKRCDKCNLLLEVVEW